jgi:Fuc2NAc and GlcNAc transferase
MYALCAAAFGVSAGLTYVVRRQAIRVGMIDRPNARSSHVLPTPRGGGLAIVVAFVAAAAAASVAGWVPWAPVTALALPGLAVAGIGWLDDYGHVPHLRRLAVHLAAIAIGMVILWFTAGGALRSVPQWSPPIVVAVWLGCGWFLNLFNFMDGIDGLAATETVFVAAAAALLLIVSGDGADLPLLWALLAASALGFLWWNRPPARIFMGDVGSGFLGCAIALLLVATDLQSTAFSAWTALALVAPFAADATTTLVRRMLRGEPWYSAHRSHAYQWLSRRWKSHGRVTGLLAIIDVVVVLPLAWATIRWADASHLLALSGFFGFCGLAWAAGAGRQEFQRVTAFEGPAAGNSDP